MAELTVDSILPPESEEDCIEYKIVYNIKGSMDELERLEASAITQIRLRMNQGNGRAVYFFGVEDNGCKIGVPMTLMLQSLNTFHAVLHKAQGRIRHVQIKCIGNSISHVSPRKITRPFYQDILGSSLDPRPARYIARIDIECVDSLRCE